MHFLDWEEQIKFLKKLLDRFNSLKLESSYVISTYFDKDKTENPVTIMIGYINGKLDDIEEIPQIHDSAISKLETDLSVPELLLLFKLLRDSKVLAHIKIKDLVPAISTVFTTKQSDDISIKRMVNEFNSYDELAVNNWRGRINEFTKLIDELEEKGRK